MDALLQVAIIRIRETEVLNSNPDERDLSK
jgi:hypothetical protein